MRQSCCSRQTRCHNPDYGHRSAEVSGFPRRKRKENQSVIKGPKPREASSPQQLAVATSPTGIPTLHYEVNTHGYQEHTRGLGRGTPCCIPADGHQHSLPSTGIPGLPVVHSSHLDGSCCPCCLWLEAAVQQQQGSGSICSFADTYRCSGQHSAAGSQQGTSQLYHELHPSE